MNGDVVQPSAATDTEVTASLIVLMPYAEAGRRTLPPESMPSATGMVQPPTDHPTTNVAVGRA